MKRSKKKIYRQGWIKGEGAGGCTLLPEMTYGFLIQLEKKKKMWFIGVSYATP